jgi:D-galactarolactone isomerase
MTIGGVCDTHIHVYDHRFPISPTTLLAPPDASLADYDAVCRELGIDRAVIVQPTTYGLDNRCQLDAVAEFGTGARAVVVVDEHATDDDIARLHDAGARGARFHMLPGGAVPWTSLAPVARRIADAGWHVQLQLNGRELVDRVDELLTLPTPLVVDHVGRFMPPVHPDDAAFRALLTLVDRGRCWVKLSAPYESSRDGAPRYPTVSTLVDQLVARAPERLLWASNWPHPGQADPPTPAELSTLRETWLPTARLQRLVLTDNPTEVYGFDPVPHPEEH